MERADSENEGSHTKGSDTIAGGTNQEQTHPS